MHIETAYEPAPTPPKAFRALRCDPTVKTPPPPPGVPLWQRIRRMREGALGAVEQARAVRASLADLSRRAS